MPPPEGLFSSELHWLSSPEIPTFRTAFDLMTNILQWSLFEQPELVLVATNNVAETIALLLSLSFPQATPETKMLIKIEARFILKVAFLNNCFIIMFTRNIEKMVSCNKIPGKP